MEPKILMIGRKQEVIDILIDELANFRRDVVGSNEKDTIKTLLEKESIDFVVIGAGLPDKDRSEMQALIQSIKPGVAVNLIEREGKGGPHKLIDFTNQKAVEWKIEQKLGKRG